jgi:hypothetical protein
MLSARRPQRALPIAAILSSAALWPATAGAVTYGTLVAHHAAEPAGSLETTFAQVRPARIFWLVVTEPSQKQLNITWSIHCINSPRRESGGATGKAIVTHGRWVKAVRANWIKHPAICSGAVAGSAAAAPALVRIYASGP